MDSSKCPHHDDLKEDIKDIKIMVQDIAKRLSQGDVSINNLKTRLHIVELLVYGGVGLTLLFVVKSVLSKVGGAS